jgi:hypothetical protein
MEMRRLLPLSGVVFVVLVVLSVLLGGSTPGGTESAAKVVSFYDSHGARAFAEAFVLVAAGFFIVLFGATLARVLAPAAESRSVWTRVAFGGSVLFAGALGMIAAIAFALADAPTKVPGASLQALNLLENDMWVLFNGALGVFMLGAAGSWLTSAVNSRWLGWVALVLGVALFIPFADFVALLASGLWIIGASVVLFRREAADAYVPAPTGA